MGLIDTLKKIFGGRSAIESRFKSDLNQSSSDSINDSIASIASNPDLNQEMPEIPSLPEFAAKKESDLFYKPLPKELPAIQTSHVQLPPMPVLAEPAKRQPTIELQKDSLELGMAAGYAGRSLKEIESSMNRIETMMASKEWFIDQFGPQLQAIYDSIRVHDGNTAKKLEMIEFLIQSLENTAKKAPEPLKTELLEQIETLESQVLTPTRKMQKLAEVVKTHGEISYTDLAKELGISESALRGLLSNTVRRISSITRFSVDGKGFVKHVGGEKTDLNQPANDLKRLASDSSASRL